MMNRILVKNGCKIEGQELNWNNGTITIDHDSEIVCDTSQIPKEIHILVLENVTCHLTFLGRSVCSKVFLTLQKNSHMIINCFTIDSSGEVLTYLTGENANLQFVYSGLCTKNTNLKMSVYHQCSHTFSHLVSNGFCMNSSSIIFDVNGYVEKQSSDCICNQDSKIIHLENSPSRIDPNLYIENYNVEASHSAYVGSFSENEIFYLMSRGISREKAYRILMESFLLGKMKLSSESREKFLSIIEEYFEKRRFNESRGF